MLMLTKILVVSPTACVGKAFFLKSISHNVSKISAIAAVFLSFFFSFHRLEQSDEIRLLREFLPRTTETLSLNSCKVLLFFGVFFFLSPPLLL